MCPLDQSQSEITQANSELWCVGFSIYTSKLGLTNSPVPTSLHSRPTEKSKHPALWVRLMPGWVLNAFSEHPIIPGSSSLLSEDGSSTHHNRGPTFLRRYQRGKWLGAGTEQVLFLLSAALRTLFVVSTKWVLCNICYLLFNVTSSLRLLLKPSLITLTLFPIPLYAHSLGFCTMSCTQPVLPAG